MEANLKNWLNQLSFNLQEIFQTIDQKIPKTFQFNRLQLALMVAGIIIVCFLLFHRTKYIAIESEAPQETNVPKIRCKRILGKTWYPTGWIYNKETELWEPPENLIAESYDRWAWDEKRGIWVDLYKQRI